ncbi:hypothetical protein DL96DRAFT_1620529 [Flagelloscypha sp. PMI_526]|nr:hypothetical protein DL96DRAFT_1620529 [Flagelloscypha sp. PMI_526]
MTLTIWPFSNLSSLKLRLFLFLLKTYVFALQWVLEIISTKRQDSSSELGSTTFQKTSSHHFKGETDLATQHPLSCDQDADMEVETWQDVSTFIEEESEILISSNETEDGNIKRCYEERLALALGINDGRGIEVPHGILGSPVQPKLPSQKHTEPNLDALFLHCEPHEDEEDALVYGGAGAEVSCLLATDFAVAGAASMLVSLSAPSIMVMDRNV